MLEYDHHLPAPGDYGNAEEYNAPVGNQVSGRTFAIFAVTPDGRVKSWNDRAQGILGYSADEIVGKHLSVFCPGSSPSAEQHLEQAERTGFYLGEGWRLRKDGTRFWAQVTLTAQRTDDGSLHGFVAVVRDEAEARARHKRSTRRFTDLFDLAPIGIVLLDERGRVIHVNQAFCDLLGYGLNDLHGKESRALLHPTDSAESIEPGPSSRHDEAEAPTLVQRTLIDSDGRARVCEVRTAASMDDGGNIFWQAVFQDVTKQRQEKELLQYRATHDELTGLLNRSGVDELLDRLLAEDGRHRISVLSSDLDNFKRVNDSLGHQAGDELLVALARRLSSGLPDQCIAARLFGDEFLIVCTDLDAVGGVDVLTNTVASLLRTVIPVRGQLVTTSASTGIALSEPGNTGEDLLRFADAAMFRAKRKHTGVSIASRELISSVSQQLHMENQLLDAIRHEGGLELHYQPIVDRNGTIIMAEALIRWQHPERGLVGPDVILAVAEQGDLMRELDRWVLRTAFREAADWPLANGSPIRITVNLSGLLPDAPRFVDEITTIMSETGIDGRRVTLEVVESFLGDLSAKPRTGIAKLAERGVWLAIDDFGTGYSSLKRLKDLSAQVIKVDRGFITGLEEDPADYAIVRAVVEMSRGMKRRCVAEGVENIRQFQMLKALGVDAFQGFLFSKAVPVSEFRMMVSQGWLVGSSSAEV